MHRFTRRNFIRLGTGAAVVLGAPQILSGCGGEEGTPKATATPKLSPTAEPSSRVAAIRGKDLYAMTREALEAVGGTQKIVNEGETVFIKPNMVMLPFAPFTGNPFVSGECAKPEIVIAVAEECLRAGAAEVIIGDGSQMPSFDWGLATTLDGSTNLVAEAERLSSEYEGNVTLACLDVDSPGWVEVPTSTYLEKVAISSLAARADRVISIPVAKSHSWGQLTLSLKNFFGLTPLERYGWRGADTMYSRALLDHSSPEAIAQLYFDIVDAVKPDLAIIDFSIGVEGKETVAGGDGPGLTVDMKDRLGSWLLLASTDLVAADATAARIMNHDAEYVDRVLTAAYERGLGEIREESIEIMGERLDNLRVDWKVAELTNESAPQGQHPARDTAHAARHAMARR